MRTDPTDTGGLFAGRRPGTAPVRFRALPERGSEKRQRVDGSFASVLLAAMIFLSLLCWGPIPLACLWVGSQVDYLSGSVSVGILVAFIGAVRAAVRHACRCCVASTTRGSSCAAPPGTTSARGALGRDLRDHRGRLRARVRVLVPRHPRARLEHRLGQRRV